jgi:hypothetical protein
LRKRIKILENDLKRTERKVETFERKLKYYDKNVPEDFVQFLGHKSIINRTIMTGNLQPSRGELDIYVSYYDNIAVGTYVSFISKSSSAEPRREVGIVVKANGRPDYELEVFCSNGVVCRGLVPDANGLYKLKYLRKRNIMNKK